MKPQVQGQESVIAGLSLLAKAVNMVARKHVGGVEQWDLLSIVTYRKTFVHNVWSRMGNSLWAIKPKGCAHVVAVMKYYCTLR